MSAAFTIPTDIPVGGPSEKVKAPRKPFRDTKIGKPLSFAGMYTIAGFAGVGKAAAVPVHVAGSIKDHVTAFLLQHPYLMKIATYAAEIFAFLVAAFIAVTILSGLLSLLGLAF